MLSISNLKAGTIFEDDGEPWQVLEYQHSKTGRAGAVLRTKLKNLETGAVVQRTIQPSEKFDEVRLERKRAQYLYEDNGYVFMDTKSYEQFTIKKEVVKETIKYIKEGEEIQLAFFEGKPLSVDLPAKVSLKVTEAPEGAKGNTATAATKQVKLETGIEVNTPLFIRTGDSIIVDTRTGQYVERG